MAAGLRVNYGDHVMDISANTRVMSFVARWSMAHTNPTASFDIRPGASIIVLPVVTVNEISNSGPVTIKYYVRMTGVSVSGNTVTLSFAGGTEYARTSNFVVDIYQVDGIAPPGAVGLFMRDSSDVMSITDAGQVAQCIMRSRIQVNQTYALGIPSDSAVFCRWEDSSGRLFLDRSTMTLYAYGSGDYATGVIDVQVVAFRNQAALPHNGGLNIYKGDGSGQLIFSTEKPPLIFNDAYYQLPSGQFDAFVSPSVPLGKPMVCMCNVGVGTGTATMNGGYKAIFEVGFRMTGGSIAAHIARATGKNNYGALDPTVASSKIPAIDADKYF